MKKFIGGALLKKFFSIILTSVLLSFVLCGCQKESSKEVVKSQVTNSKSNNKQALDVREAVWNQLTKKEKVHIVGTWKEASVQKIILRKSMGIINDKKFIGREVFIIDYPSNDNASIGGIVVYADIKSHQLIGYGYRD
jgi:fructose-specific component phosphotransferase system IIB-like protein